MRIESVYASFLEQEKLLEIKNGVALLNMKNSDVHVLPTISTILFPTMEKCM